MLDMVVRFSLPNPKALHPVRTFWMERSSEGTL